MTNTEYDEKRKSKFSPKQTAAKSFKNAPDKSYFLSILRSLFEIFLCFKKKKKSFQEKKNSICASFFQEPVFLPDHNPKYSWSAMIPIVTSSVNFIPFPYTVEPNGHPAIF